MDMCDVHVIKWNQNYDKIYTKNQQGVSASFVEPGEQNSQFNIINFFTKIILITFFVDFFWLLEPQSSPYWLKHRVKKYLI